jgi:phosphatidylethanolamine/phosphatidyl-N-methylethanolamine N-methyltransferase
MTDDGGVLYSKFSRFYDPLFRWVTLPRQREAIRGAGIRPGSRVMDLGVGTGLSLNLYPSGCRVTGVDISDEMLCLARRRVDRWRLDNVDLHCVDAGAVDEAFPPHHFDYVFAAFVISVVEDPVDVLKRIRRIGKEDCTFVLVNHFRSLHPVMATVERALEPLCNRIGWKNGVNLDEVLRASGLAVIRKKKYLPTDIWTIVYARNASCPS